LIASQGWRGILSCFRADITAAISEGAGGVRDRRSHNRRLRYKGRILFLGDTDIYVPGEEVVYVAPSLILHYLQHHQYQPPLCFVDRVLNCPEPLSEEYSAAITRIAPEINLPLPSRSR
jgi:hypothetical protein